MMAFDNIVQERGRFYWIDSDGERVSPCYDSEDDCWQWADEQTEE